MYKAVPMIAIIARRNSRIPEAILALKHSTNERLLAKAPNQPNRRLRTIEVTTTKQTGTATNSSIFP